MKTLRRYNAPHADYFITGVTYQRRPILLTDPQLFFESWVLVDLDAWVLLEDHFHVIFNVGDFNVSHVLHHFKITYSRRFRDLYGAGRVWQNRFWDHVIRGSGDFRCHLDYIHYNPVHHDLCADPFDYPFSSIMKWTEMGVYQRSWGVERMPSIEGEFGE